MRTDSKESPAKKTATINQALLNEIAELKSQLIERDQDMLKLIKSHSSEIEKITDQRKVRVFKFTENKHQEQSLPEFLSNLFESTSADYLNDFLGLALRSFVSSKFFRKDIDELHRWNHIDHFESIKELILGLEAFEEAGVIKNRFS